MGKKIKLENLRITSFVTEVRKQEQDHAKGGTNGESTWQFICESYPNGPTCYCPQTGSCGCGSGDPTNYPSNPAQFICV